MEALLESETFFVLLIFKYKTGIIDNFMSAVSVLFIVSATLH
jgi:hypothetical protein